jgi:FixJ family two-component response regulator
MSKQEQTVFVVDDDDSVRKSLSRLFRSAGITVETFASAQNFLDRAYFGGNGCLILDLNMPGLSGHELHRELLKADYSMPIVYLTGHGDIPTGVQAIKEGAVDFLTKPVDDQQLLDAVQTALKKDAKDRSAYSTTLRIRELLSTLTARELEVLTYVISGMLNKQIAAALGISEATIKVHRGRVTEKLGVYSVAELVRLAEIGGVLPADISTL